MNMLTQQNTKKDNRIVVIYCTLTEADRKLKITLEEKEALLARLTRANNEVIIEKFSVNEDSSKDEIIATYLRATECCERYLPDCPRIVMHISRWMRTIIEEHIANEADGNPNLDLEKNDVTAPSTAA